MAIFKDLKNAFLGKPLSSDTPIPNDASSPADEEVKVYVDETDSRVQGDRLEIYCKIKNYSNRNVFLDKMRLLGVNYEIDDNLKANERKQFVVYKGDLPSNTADHDAELQYRTDDGVYYKARHDVRFKPYDDKFIVERLPYENTSTI